MKLNIKLVACYKEPQRKDMKLMKDMKSMKEDSEFFFMTFTFFMCFMSFFWGSRRQAICL